ncbi:MAG: hypothetical protein KF767_08905 [Bdellovibrionaceae bacterium]|nr:hypothetical protein [Pseudobdellovibrionaceae bacterium]
MKHSEKANLFVPSGEDTRRGFRLWFNREFIEMVENAIAKWGWDDKQALAKAYEAADVMLKPIRTADPPTIHIKIKNSKVTVTLHWPESQERH